MKFEFGDLYKFAVSLGVILISISILTPWLFLREPFDFFKTEAELKAITEVSRQVILSRQESVSLILKIIPWFSAICSMCGAVFIYVGLKRWYANQLLLDEQTKIEVELKKQSLRDATKDEITLATEKDFKELEIPDATSSEIRFSSFETSYLMLEQHVANRLRDIFSVKYKIELNKVVGGIELDVLMSGKSKFTKDLIIEIKLIRRGFNYGWLRESYLKNIYAKNIYTQVTGRSPNTLLLIIADFPGPMPEKYADMRIRLIDEELGRKGMDRAIMITKNEFDIISSEKLQKDFDLYA